MSFLIVESLAKVVHNVVALAFILCGQAACQGLEQTLVTLCLSPEYALNSSLQSHILASSWYDFYKDPWDKHFPPCLPRPSFCIPLTKTLENLTTTQLFDLNWPIWLQPRNPKALHPWTLIKACAPGPAGLFDCILPWPPQVGPLKTYIVLSSEPWVINASISIPLWSFIELCGSPSDIPGLFLTNVNLLRIVTTLMNTKYLR